jgi:hypothetical protein
MYHKDKNTPYRRSDVLHEVVSLIDVDIKAIVPFLPNHVRMADLPALFCARILL